MTPAPDDLRDAFAALDWQVELGADEAILDAPVDRYAAPPPAEPKAPPTSAPPPPSAEFDPVAAAAAAARAASDLEGLRAALAAFEGCDLKRGARNLCFADGDPAADIMIVGEAPDRDEDLSGRPFAGRAGALFDRMFAAIGLSRESGSLYVTNALPWRPPQNRPPSEAEIAMLLPFLKRHIELAGPKLLVVMGATPALALLGRGGITRLRGTWSEAMGRPVMPMLHPDHLLRNPAAKREAWSDLLSLRDRM